MKKFILLLMSFVLLCLGCKKEKDPTPTPSPTYANIDFGNVYIGQPASKSFQLKITQPSGDVTISATNGFLLLSDLGTYVATMVVPSANAVNKTVYVQFAPTSSGAASGNVTISIAGGASSSFNVSGTGLLQQTFTTFVNKRLAFGTGLSQSAEQSFNLPNDLSPYEKIFMYVKLACPTGGCNAWDVFAHVQVKNPATQEWFELGRYITPYGVDNHQLSRGFKIDVSDFRSLLKGNVQLRAFVEVWGADGWLVSVDFDYIAGTPDYPYYAVSKVVQYNRNSLEGVPYGEDATAFDLTKTITLPANAEKSLLRTIITGWGHATPNDAGGRPCAEWCYRTHNIKINGANTFQHYMGPIGCANNAVQPQSGNWQPDRAGWCPGMEVPVRTDVLNQNLAGQTFSYEYALQPWVNDMQSTADNKHAYYAISTYVIVKSNTPIQPAVVVE